MLNTFRIGMENRCFTQFYTNGMFSQQNWGCSLIAQKIQTKDQHLIELGKPGSHAIRSLFWEVIKEDQIFNGALSDCSTGHNLSRELWPKIGSQITRN